jgi:hypothetical protein
MVNSKGEKVIDPKTKQQKVLKFYDVVTLTDRDQFLKGDRFIWDKRMGGWVKTQTKISGRRLKDTR